MVASLGMVVTCLSGSVAGAQAGPRTQAERTGYLETSSHESVMAFLDSLVRPGPADCRRRDGENDRGA
jgi:hypothetical protein